MKTKLPALILGGALLAIGSLASSPAQADKYIYYPAQQVYFSPARTTYYYMDNGTWRYNTVLPSSVQLGKSVSVDLVGETPYVHHSTVIQQYPVTTTTPARVIKVDD
ncbi:MAG TPA: hypothetical protein VJR29_07300 [bacterium]|nr:hypothetical protein [bacterium]